MDVIGIRLRLLHPKPGQKNKSAIWGGNGGLFIPRGLSEGGRLLICEGPTDLAALLDLGFNAVGRESCSAGTQHVVELIKAKGFAEIVIASQRDEAKPRNKHRPELGVFYPGQEGAQRLARAVRGHHTIVRVIEPPAGTKDYRDWKRAGATASDVERQILRTAVRKLTIKSAAVLEGAGLV